MGLHQRREARHTAKVVYNTGLRSRHPARYQPILRTNDRLVAITPLRMRQHPRPARRFSPPATTLSKSRLTAAKSHQERRYPRAPIFKKPTAKKSPPKQHNEKKSAVKQDAPVPRPKEENDKKNHCLVLKLNPHATKQKLSVSSSTVWACVCGTNLARVAPRDPYRGVKENGLADELHAEMDQTSQRLLLS